MGWIFGLFVVLFIVAALAQLFGYGWAARRRRRLLTEAPADDPLVFLDARLAVAPAIAGRSIPEGYRLASLFFGTGLIDRTKTLDQGFDYQVLDPIPAPGRTASMADLLKRRAGELRARSNQTGKPVRLFWSGGVDSTAAACALLQAFIDAPKRLEIVHTAASQREYRLFHKHYVAPHPANRRVKTIREALDDRAILTTGEHGDQLFGSMKALRLRWRDLNAPWEDSLPGVLTRQLRGADRADTTLRYLEPQIAACPIALPRLFDLLWWLNFSLKWQAVSLRMFADGKPRTWGLLENTAHFFRSDDFQRWSLANPDQRIRGERWPSYKWPLKDAILAFTGDQAYADRKRKVPSLRGRLGARDLSMRGLAMGVTASGRSFFQEYDRSLRSEGWSIEFTSEGRLWREIDDDGE